MLTAAELKENPDLLIHPGEAVQRDRIRKPISKIIMIFLGNFRLTRKWFTPPSDALVYRNEVNCEVDSIVKL